MKKVPERKPFKVRHKKSHVRYTFRCVHSKDGEKYGFINMARTNVKILSPTYMDIHFDLV